MLPGAASAQDQVLAVRIRLPDLRLDPTLRTYAAVVTSGYTNCQVRILDDNQHLMEYSREWGTEPNVPLGQVLQGSLPGRRPILCPTELLLRPTRLQTPSVAAAITQTNELQLGGMKPVSFRQGPSTDQDELNKLKASAKSARFITDPARPPGGRFELMIWHPGSIMLCIWANDQAVGPPLYRQELPDRAAGSNTVPWDLRTSKGNLVKTGRYLATLTCKPTKMPGVQVQPTTLASYFAVITT